MAAPFNWYKANITNVQYESDRVLPDTADKLDIPVLYIGATEDLVCRPETLIPSIQQGLLPRLEQAEMVEAAHWVTYENPGPVVERIRGWLGREFGR
jgi:pimeloyl-ACP methyl ester carboxylesterase